MKTAISIPDDAYRRVEEAAARAGMNRSEFFVTAALRYVDLSDDQSLVKRVDEVLDRAGGRASADDDFIAAGQRALRSSTSADENW